jgi:hypothetical protein
MRTLLSIFVVLIFAIKLSAADTNAPTLSKTNTSTPLKIGTGEADKYYGQEMIVTGKVAQVTIRPKVIFLNLDRPYPDSPFTVVVFPGKYLADVKALDEKAVEIKGTIKNYHDKPEIVLDNPDQLTVLGSTASTNAPAATQPTNPPPPSPPTQSTNFPEIM